MLTPRDFINLKTDGIARGNWLPAATANVRATSTSNGGKSPHAMPAAAADFDVTDPALRALYLFKRPFAAGSAYNASGVSIRRAARARAPGPRLMWRFDRGAPCAAGRAGP